MGTVDRSRSRFRVWLADFDRLDEDRHCEQLVNLAKAELKNPRLCFEHYVESTVFTTISSLAILANSAYMGWDCERKITSEVLRIRSEDSETPAPVGDYIFTVFFVVELLMRVLAQKKTFVMGPDANLNMADFLLIGASVYELCASGSGSLSVFRILRIFRLVRLLRVIRRIQCLESLNMMVQGILNCFAPLLWAMIILLLIIYAFAVFFMNVVATHLASVGEGPESEQVLELEEEYSTIFKVMNLLFEAATGGMDWADHAGPMKGIHVGYHLIFGVYIVFITLGVLNIVTGFFVDGTMQASMDTREEMVKLAVEKKGHMAEIIRNAFHHLDTDESGTLSLAELDAHLHDQLLQEYLCALEINTEEAKALFDILNIDGTDAVDIDAFIEGVQKLTSSVKAIDVYSIMNQNMKVFHMVGDLTHIVTRDLAYVKKVISPGGVAPLERMHRCSTGL
eukprot:NODE_398_length_1599_cov_384.083549.p1 GENE.NODE_398_length_1599_cov_384.083549~~NODE_398_length_1599_cov_384.083549.p1  ORF type:complete len:453 (+),score=196.39 NODE_398_length_1599_cov_384.083549:3-1361(+)